MTPPRPQADAALAKGALGARGRVLHLEVTLPQQQTPAEEHLRLRPPCPSPPFSEPPLVRR